MKQLKDIGNETSDAIVGIVGLVGIIGGMALMLLFPVHIADWPPTWQGGIILGVLLIGCAGCSFFITMVVGVRGK